MARTVFPEKLVLVLVRLILGLVFAVNGIDKFTSHTANTIDFDRWGLPAPSAFAYSIGVLELACGLAVLAGILTRPAALLLAGNMVGALLTAGRVDGGSQLVVPPILGALALLL